MGQAVPHASLCVGALGWALSHVSVDGLSKLGVLYLRLIEISFNFGSGLVVFAVG